LNTCIITVSIITFAVITTTVPRWAAIVIVIKEQFSLYRLVLDLCSAGRCDLLIWSGSFRSPKPLTRMDLNAGVTVK
jgi:hypothetical protein